MSTALTAAAFEYAENGAVERHSGPGLMLLDLDHFKNVNDSLGHHAGDRLLCLVADRLADSVRSQDVLARVGGDEFAVLFPGAVELADMEAVATRIVESLDEPFHLSEMSVRIQASIGLALCPVHCVHPEELLQRADVAMYCAKGGPSRVDRKSVV